MNDTYRIPEGGVCGAFNTTAATEKDRQVKTAQRKAIARDKVDWNKMPTPEQDPWIRVAEVVEEIEGEEYVDTHVLQDTLEMIRQRHHGDEPTTDQESAVNLIEETLRQRGQDPGYAE